MLDFITNHLATVIIGLSVLSGLILIVIKLIGDKRRGKTGCSCGCEGCAMKSVCHEKNSNNSKSE